MADAPAGPPGDAPAVRKRLHELDGVRRLLEARAAEVEVAAAAVEREKEALKSSYAGKIRDIADAKARLEVQVRGDAVRRDSASDGLSLSRHRLAADPTWLRLRARVRR